MFIATIIENVIASHLRMDECMNEKKDVLSFKMDEMVYETK